MMADLGLEKSLSALIELRVSQINQCAYCVNLHLSDARKAGVGQKKLDNLIVWKHVDVFTRAERGAFAWAEALTFWPLIQITGLCAPHYVPITAIRTLP